MVGIIRDSVVERLSSAGGGIVTGINGLTGAVTLAAGANITLTPVGNTITISAEEGTGNGRTVVAAGAVTMVNTDGIVNIKKTVGAATAVTAPPAPPAWQVYTVKDAKGDAFTNNITITPSSGTIDGEATYVITQNYDSVDFYSDGTNLFTK